MAFNFVPSGTILPFGGATAPSGWLLCDGSAISRSTYAALFSAISTAWGYGDNSTTFNLPDMRGRFPRGRDAGIARDPDRASRTASNTGGNTGDAVGSVQGHNYGSHGHPFYSYVGPGPGSSGAGLVSQNQASDVTYASGAGLPSVQSSGGNETRPINANVNYIIKI